jgi:hypothetical protein
MQNSGAEKSAEKNCVVYHFRPDLGYPIFLQFNDLELEQEMQFVIHELGFAISKKDTLDQAAKERRFRLLKISGASSKVLKKITSYSQHSFGLGQELVENFGYYEVYVMMKYSMMIMSQSSPHWEIALNKDRIITRGHEVETQNALRLCLNRFLASALAFMEVMAFWGKIQNKTTIISAQAEANNHCVFIDVVKNKIFSNAQNALAIEQAKIAIANPHNALIKEELFGILASRALYFSSGQIPKAFMIQQIARLIKDQHRVFIESSVTSVAA